IENGALRHVVKNPNYRGISAEFWRSLAHVGNADTVRVLGTPFCGKGEPSQTIRVGHASPACVFTNVDVFGGEACGHSVQRPRLTWKAISTTSAERSTPRLSRASATRRGLPRRSPISYASIAARSG